VQIPRQSDQLTRTFTMSGATSAKIIHARFKNAFVTTDRFKKIASFEKGDSEKITGCGSRLASFTLGNNRFLMRKARVAFDHLVPRNVSVFSQRHLFRMDDPPWRETM
jgi:hypothetical protein